MFAPNQYQLVDFGEGRKLERFGPHLIDRPCPAAVGARRRDPDVWSQAAARFEKLDRGTGGRWYRAPELARSWSIYHGSVRFEIKPTESGHLGVFAEQATNWDWIAQQVRRRQACRVLNLFAYTGGATLAAAAAGAQVVHVDAARNVVVWARQNAQLSGLAEAPVRWIAEDAATFVRRETRRGNKYDAIILDPPSYGHGPRGEVWKFTRDLPLLLQGCGQLLVRRPAFLLITSHTPGCGPPELAASLSDCLLDRRMPADVQAHELSLVDTRGRPLSSGVVARWQGPKEK